MFNDFEVNEKMSARELEKTHSKKGRTYFQSEAKFDESLQGWLDRIAKELPALCEWSNLAARSCYEALLELYSRHQIPPHEPLMILTHNRAEWSDFQKLSRDMDAEHQQGVKTARRLKKLICDLKRVAAHLETPEQSPNFELIADVAPKLFRKPKHRPKDVELERCAFELRSFLQRRGVADYNRLGAELLAAAFPEWKPQKPIDDFRHVAASFPITITSRGDALAIMQRAEGRLLERVTEPVHPLKTTARAKTISARTLRRAYLKATKPQTEEKKTSAMDERFLAWFATLAMRPATRTQHEVRWEIAKRFPGGETALTKLANRISTEGAEKVLISLPEREKLILYELQSNVKPGGNGDG